MHYASVEGLTKSYGIHPLFQNLHFHIEAGDKIALIALNGSGKTTLLRVLAGKEAPEEGRVWIHKDVRVAYFEQDPVFPESATVLDYIFELDHPVVLAVKTYEAATAKEDPEALSAALQRMDELGAWNVESRVKEILSKLSIEHLDEPIQNLSGGQRRRVALARTLVDIAFSERHIFLLLDEPTNHLDLEMVEWLEQYLSREKLTLLLVTHDRQFLDTVCEEIWELEPDHLFRYLGGFEQYLEQKSARLQQQSASWEKVKQAYRKELEWMRKQPRARTTKSKSRQDQFYSLEAMAKIRPEERALQLEMKMNRLGGKIAECKKLYKRFGDQVLFRGFDYTFKKGERLGIIGRNGVGKTSLVRLLLGLEPPDSGKIQIGETVVFGHYTQEGLVLKDDCRVIDLVKDIAENFPLAKGGSLSASLFLERFLFSPERQYTPISSLSGGEKRRLHLLTVLFRNPNFLILDEPTNDLDLPTLAVLEEFLKDFQGCLVIISHDRYFMDRLVDHLLVMEGMGQIIDFPGNYSQYRDERQARDPEPPMILRAEIPMATKKSNPSEEKAASSRRLTFKEKRELDLLQREILDLEEEKKQLHDRIYDPQTGFEDLQAFSTRVNAIEQLLEEKEWRWLELSEASG
jgi:ATP-binding cassette subfamily F protein uup